MTPTSKLGGCALRFLSCDLSLKKGFVFGVTKVSPLSPLNQKPLRMGAV
jgi:hypothetical protein